MSFGSRIGQTNSLIQVVKQTLFGDSSIAKRLMLVPLGYENLAPPGAKDRMRYNRTTTAKFIRFMPDCFVIDTNAVERVYLLDYKTTQTPIYSESRLRLIATKAKEAIGWQDIGQMESDAFDNYSLLAGIGVRVAVLNYCAYHSRLLLCDFVDNIRVLHRDVVTTDAELGSRTPYINFDCRSMRTYADFLMDEHGLVPAGNVYETVKRQLSQSLPIRHHSKSPLNTGRTL